MQRLHSRLLAIALCLAPLGTSLAQVSPPLDDATVIAAVVPLVAADAEVTRVIGAPIHLDGSAYDGTIDLSGRDNGSLAAHLVFELAGTYGHAKINVEAAQVEGGWKILRLDVAGR